jgi:hypothetical protein
MINLFRLKFFILLFVVPTNEGGTKWQRNAPPPLEVSYFINQRVFVSDKELD